MRSYMLRIMGRCRRSSGSMDGHTSLEERSARGRCWYGMRSTRMIFMELSDRLDTLEATLEADEVQNRQRGSIGRCSACSTYGTSLGNRIFDEK
jgi:hypothetical protein